MPPADNNTPVPEPKAPKIGFLAKLFGKKPAPAAPVAPVESNTPPPQLDDPALPPVVSPSVDASPVAPQQTDPITGAPQVDTVSGPDPSGDVTAPELNVPDSLTDTSEGETPTLPVQPQQPPVDGETPQQTPPGSTPQNPQQ